MIYQNEAYQNEAIKEMTCHLILADDDADDCLFFEEALEDFAVPVSLKTVNDGEALMRLLLTDPEDLPDALFLDLNMPRKNGFDCLSEIKANDQLKQLPVIIFSTSMDLKVADMLYLNGAHYYIRKPSEFPKLKQVVREAIAIILKNPARPAREEFILQS